MSSTNTLSVDPSNADQARAWDGNEGAYWATHAEEFEQTLTPYNPPLLAAAQITPTARVLDVGCGTGDVARAAARLAAAGHVLGVDLSTEMISQARRRASADGLTNVEFLRADAQVHPLGLDVFDVIVSRTGTMFFGDPIAAFRNLARSLRPSGRLAMLVWQDFDHNEWIRSIAAALVEGRGLPIAPLGAPGPFSLRDPDRTREILARAGFEGIGIAGISLPMYFGPTVDRAYDLISGLTAWMLQGVDETGRTRALGRLRATIEAHRRTGQGVLFGSACWLITATRQSPVEPYGNPSAGEVC